MDDVLKIIKRHLTTFGFNQIGEDVYLRPAMMGLNEVYLSFLDEYLVFVTNDNAVHMNYEDILYNIELYRKNPMEGFNERTLFTQALEMLKK